MREQGEAQRAEWARDEQQRQQELAAERNRRDAIEAKVREKEKLERETRKAHAELDRHQELEAMKRATQLIDERLAQKGFIEIREVANVVKRDPEWVQQLVHRAGMLGKKSSGGDQRTVMLTRSSWLVCITATIMDQAYQQTAISCGRREGKITWNEMGRLVQDAATKG
jgi:hypothetical protein